MSKGKTVLPGMTGNITAYKIADLVNMLVKKGVRVHALMTENTTHFINPITFENLVGNRCLVDTFDGNFKFSVEHVTLVKQVDVVMITPVSADAVGKIAHSIVDGMLTTTVMACRCRKILAPTINTNMYENPTLQDNLDVCRRYGIGVITPAWGYLAYRDTEAGKVPGLEVLYEYILRETGCPGDLAGGRIPVTAGPTRESIDPVYYITDRSTGKMGYAVTRVAVCRGTDVTLVSGPVGPDRPLLVETAPVESAREMFEAVTAKGGEQDIIVKAVAMVGCRPFAVGIEKIKKSDGGLSIALKRTDDILGWLEQSRRDGQFLCGFSMEAQNMLENSRTELAKEQIDMIVANNPKVEGAGFDADINVVMPIIRESETELPIISKEEVADRLLTEVLKRIEG